jgi:hypothetical protein
MVVLLKRHYFPGGCDTIDGNIGLHLMLSNTYRTVEQGFIRKYHYCLFCILGYRKGYIDGRQTGSDHHAGEQLRL